MKKEAKDALRKSVQNLVSSNLSADQQNPLSQQARRMALTEGQVLHISPVVDKKGESTMTVDHITNADGTVGNAFFGFNTDEEIVVTTSQIARRGNGMKLQGGTTEDMLIDFCEKVTDAWEKNAAVQGYKGPAVKVTELRTRPGRNGLQVIPMFQVTW